MHSIIKFTRRKFLQVSPIAVLSPSLFTGKIIKEGQKEQKIDSRNILNYHPDMLYRKLGNTDIHLSVLSLGGGGLKEAVAHYCIDRGVNLIHMSDHYNRGNSIKELGKVLKTKRDRVYIAVKADFRDIDSVLGSLQTDYIDFLMFPRHNENQVNNQKDIDIFERYRSQGKVRFAGLTTHDQVKRCVNSGINGGKYTVLMPALNQPNLELLNQELEAAYKQGIGIIAMKVMKGIKDKELQSAYLKKVIKNPSVTTVNKGINSFRKFDMYQKAIKESLSLKEDFSLYRYAQKNRSNNCMMCGECEEECPFNIQISTLLRCKDYYYDQLKDRYSAIKSYQDIPYKYRNISKCKDCRKCELYCPNGIAIVKKLNETKEFFSKIT